tara:strand:- start:407 stop:574 length:168 start_codon:yes stop_codon:yes gene_type:complete
MKFESILNSIGVVLGVMMLLSVILALTSCSHRTHIITEYDGDRKIEWYSTKNNKK